jgi:hypothetical protein
MSDYLVLIDTSVWILVLRKSPLLQVRDEVEMAAGEDYPLY